MQEPARVAAALYHGGCLAHGCLTSILPTMMECLTNHLKRSAVRRESGDKTLAYGRALTHRLDKPAIAVHAGHRARLKWESMDGLGEHITNACQRAAAALCSGSDPATIV